MEGSGHCCGCASLWITRIGMIMIGLQLPGLADKITEDLLIPIGKKRSLCSLLFYFLEDNTNKLRKQGIIERDLIQISRPVDKEIAFPLFPP